jgi:predicted ABC-type ATPase
MNEEIPRLRMFAGPNGSGKSILKSRMPPELFGIYINPDEIQKEIREKKVFNLESFGISASKEEVINFLSQSSVLKETCSLQELTKMPFDKGIFDFSKTEADEYFPSAISDFLHHKLISNGKSFTFETVMSFEGKVQLLQKAQDEGYRTYLYYIATEDPAINISRICHRVKMGGHNVPEDKIISRYDRSLNLLMDAVQSTNRAYIFDNSIPDNPLWVAEITEGKTLELKTELMPVWFKKHLWDKFYSEAKHKS